MKKFQLLFFVILALSLQVDAKIWRVNNNAGITADFTTIQDAHDAALNGDTIYVEASTKSYGSLRTVKNLFIIGTGLFLNENPEIQAIPYSAMFSNVDFSYNAFSTSANSTITGIITSSVSIRTMGVNVVKCKTNNIEIHSVNFITIANCYVGDGIAYNSISASKCSNVVIKNSIIKAGIYLDGEYGIIENNIVKGNLTCNNSTVKNNIFTGAKSVYKIPLNTISNNKIYNNVVANAMLGTQNNNFASINPETLFVCWNDGEKCADYSTDASFELLTTSMAKGTGFGGTDCGIFGGDTPWVLSCIPAVPTIYYFYLKNTNNSVQVDLKVKSY